MVGLKARTLIDMHVEDTGTVRAVYHLPFLKNWIVNGEHGLKADSFFVFGKIFRDNG